MKSFLVESYSNSELFEAEWMEIFLTGATETESAQKFLLFLMRECFKVGFSLKRSPDLSPI